MSEWFNGSLSPCSIYTGATSEESDEGSKPTVAAKPESEFATIARVKKEEVDNIYSDKTTISPEHKTLIRR
jgi:hypothetical protein